jgi:hypothetical protein
LGLSCRFWLWLLSGIQYGLRCRVRGSLLRLCHGLLVLLVGLRHLRLMVARGHSRFVCAV